MLVSVSFSVQKIKTISTRANNSIPGAITITNITDNSATITWITDTKTIGWIIYGENHHTVTRQAFDDRDVAHQKNKYKLHHVTLKNLKENNTYFFKIVHNTASHTSSNDLPSFKTSSHFSLQESIKPAFGKSINTNGSPVGDGIVFLKIEGAIPLSTLTKSTGEWLIPLYYLINKKTYKPFTLTYETPLTIEIRNENDETASMTTTISQISPLPQTIVMGEKNEYREEKTNVLSTTTTTVSPPLTDFDIIFPKENAVIPGKQPLIKGIAPPESLIIVHLAKKKPSSKSASAKPAAYTINVKSDKEGIWTVIPTYHLSEEEYSITITTHDADGKIMAKTRTFTIAKSGESVLGEATPEATITQVITPTTLPTIQPSIIATNTSSPPVTGVTNVPIPIIGIGLLVIGIGFIILF